MSAPLRFLAVAMIGWAGVRAATLGFVPGTEAFTSTAEALPAQSAIIPTVFPPLEPVSSWSAAQPLAEAYYPARQPMTPPQVHYYLAAPLQPQQAAPLAAAAGATGRLPILPEPEPHFYAPIPQLDDWPLSRLASTLGGRRNSSPVPDARPGPDRLQLSAWALLRGRPGSGALAAGGTLGGSQAGARLTYALDPRLALSVRSYSPVGSSSGGELASGVRLTPLPALPISVTVERRQAIGRAGGRSAFAALAEGGIYQRPLPWNLSLDAYGQAGVVGLRSRDLFADGAMTVMRPIRGRFSAGVGIWGGMQPDLYRVDAGPRLSMRVRHNMRVDLDWRQRIAGHAEPGSGPAVTLAGNF